MTPNKTVIILGMHRSGTSLTASWLHAMGLHIGEKLLGENFSNKNGHFEDIEFLHLHEDILEEQDEHPWGLCLKKESFKLSSNQIEKIKNLCDKKNSKHKQWGFKEPRTCLFSADYDQILNSATYIIVYRSAVEVADSIVRREIKRIRVNYKKLNFFKKLKHFFRFKKLIRLEKNKFNEYLSDWVIYNDLLIQLMDKTSKNYILFDIDSLIVNDKQVFEFLISEGIDDMTYVPFSTIYKKSEMNSMKESSLPKEIDRVLKTLENLKTFN